MMQNRRTKQEQNPNSFELCLARRRKESKVPNYDKMIQEKAERVFSVMGKRVSQEDVTRIKEAFEFAKMAHADQKRRSGEPYIIHPIEVASIVAGELELGANPVIAAFLHDVVEDTEYTIGDIQKRFGKDVAFLVSVLTKKKKKHYVTSKQVDNYKQMLDSINYDIRALLIKLADRLHNMRTLGSMPPEKQMKIASETISIYGPLANRLGLYPIKIELENLSFRYCLPHKYEEIARFLRRDELSNEGRLHYFTDKIRMALGEEFCDVYVYPQYRTPYSIWRRMQQMGVDFIHVPFRHVVEIVFPCQDLNLEKDVALKIYSKLTSEFYDKPCSVISYIDRAKGNGYQSYHVQLLSEFGCWEEVHISSERMVHNNHVGIVAERREDTVHQWIDKFRSVLRDWASHQKDSDFILDVSRSFYNDDIMVFTPKGHAVSLPKGATALDFAFEIHSDIGGHAVYALINHQLAPVTTVLQRGDIVEIGTDPEAIPEKSWSDSVITYKAKKDLKKYLPGQVEMKYRVCPHCHPIPGEEVIGFVEKNGTITVHRRNCLTAIHQASRQGDSIVSVDYQESPNELFPASLCVKGFICKYDPTGDMINCISNVLHLPIDSYKSGTKDRIFNCTIHFRIHSVTELESAKIELSKIKGVVEIK